MSYFISSISALGFQRNAARVEGDTLADKDHRLLLFRAAVVLQGDQLGRLAAAVGNGKQGSHAQLFHVLAFKHGDFQLMHFAQCARLFGQITGRADIWAGDSPDRAQN
jgi:hypothetical protein